MTFSITAVDSAAEKAGVAIASVFPSVGAVCPWVSEDGAVSSQAWDSGADYGEPALSMLADDLSLQTVAEALVEERAGGAGTQFHGVTKDGQTYAYTGEKCVGWAGHVEAEDHTTAGNMLVGERVVESMSGAFEEATGPLEERLLTALEAGEEAGGDKRGDNLSAALLVHGPESRLSHNLRVDRPGQPIEDLWAAYHTARETDETDDRERLDEHWGGEMPDSVTEFRIRY